MSASHLLLQGVDGALSSLKLTQLLFGAFMRVLLFLLPFLFLLVQLSL